jgi:hypothetical protein
VALLKTNVQTKVSRSRSVGKFANASSLYLAITLTNLTLVSLIPGAQLSNSRLSTKASGLRQMQFQSLQSILAWWTQQKDRLERGASTNEPVLSQAVDVHNCCKPGVGRSQFKKASARGAYRRGRMPPAAQNRAMA